MPVVHCSEQCRSTVPLDNLLHSPPQPWCEWCIRGRGRDDPHIRLLIGRRLEKTSLICMDLAFFKSSDDKGCEVTGMDAGTSLVVIDQDTGTITQIPMPSKSLSKFVGGNPRVTRNRFVKMILDMNS